MAIELHHLQPNHDDELSFLKAERMALVSIEKSLKKKESAK